MKNDGGKCQQIVSYREIESQIGRQLFKFVESYRTRDINILQVGLNYQNIYTRYVKLKEKKSSLLMHAYNILIVHAHHIRASWCIKSVLKALFYDNCNVCCRKGKTPQWLSWRIEKVRIISALCIKQVYRAAPFFILLYVRLLCPENYINSALFWLHSMLKCLKYS